MINLFYYNFKFSSILSIIILFILFESLFIILIKSFKFNTITSKSEIALTVAVLCSSLSKAISQKISQGFNSATFLPQIDIVTFHLFKI
jgi:hypothetical protein